MDGSSRKIYHQQDEYNPRHLYDIMLSADSHPTLLESIVYFPMRQLYKELTAGHIQGRTLLQYNPGPAPYKLLVCCEFFEEINVLGFQKENSQELRKWLKNDPGALDWMHFSQYACSLEGNSNEWIKKEEKLRERVKRVIDGDLTADDLVATGILPLVDCILSMYGLELISKDQDDFRKNLRKMASLLKVGGHLALFGVINGKSYTVGEHLFHVLGYSEVFLRTALRDTGFVIESLEDRPWADVGNHVIYDSIVYVRALKERDV